MKRIILFLFLSFSSSIVYSCSCSYEWPFCWTNYYRSDYNVIYGTIIDSSQNSIRILVYDVLRGNENRDSIVVWDNTDDTTMCNFPHKASGIGYPNTNKIMILPKIDSVRNPWDVVGDYYRPYSFCHEHFISAYNDSVYGYINGDKSWPRAPIYQKNPTWKMSLTDFLSWYDNNSGCEFVSIAENESNASASLNIKGDIIQIEIPYLAKFNLEIIDTQGSIIYQKDILRSTEIDLPSHKQGIYICRLLNEKHQLVDNVKFYSP